MNQWIVMLTPDRFGLGRPIFATDVFIQFNQVKFVWPNNNCHGYIKNLLVAKTIAFFNLEQFTFAKLIFLDFVAKMNKVTCFGWI